MPAAALPPSAKLRSLVSGHRLRAVLVGLGILLLAWAAWQVATRYRATHSSQPVPAPGMVVSHSTDQPNETPVTPQHAYAVPADQPRSIAIAAIGVNALIQKVGLDQHQAPAVPTNISVAGWFVASVKPGDAGVALLDGHVQGRYQPGVFKRLHQLQAGQELTVTYGDGSQRRFRVRSVTTHTPDAAAAAQLTPVSGIASQLNLITCGGTYDARTKQYDKRILVVTERL